MEVEQPEVKTSKILNAAQHLPKVRQERAQLLVDSTISAIDFIQSKFSNWMGRNRFVVHVPDDGLRYTDHENTVMGEIIQNVFENAGWAVDHVSCTNKGGQRVLVIVILESANGKGLEPSAVAAYKEMMQKLLADTNQK